MLENFHEIILCINTLQWVPSQVTSSLIVLKTMYWKYVTIIIGQLKNYKVIACFFLYIALVVEQCAVSCMLIKKFVL